MNCRCSSTILSGDGSSRILTDIDCLPVSRFRSEYLGTGWFVGQASIDLEIPLAELCSWGQLKVWPTELNGDCQEDFAEQRSSSAAAGRPRLFPIV
jgi:hypothetical protein